MQTPDARWTRWAAANSRDATEPSGPGVDPTVLIIEHPARIPIGSTRAELTRTIRETLASGRCVCVKGVYDPMGWAWDREAFKVMSGSATLDHGVEWIGEVYPL